MMASSGWTGQGAFRGGVLPLAPPPCIRQSSAAERYPASSCEAKSRTPSARLLHLPLSLALFYLGLPQQAVETFTTLPERVILMRRVPLDCALLAFALCCLTAWELCKACAEQKTPGDP